MNDKGQAVDLYDLLKGLDLNRADSRAGLGALLREVDERLNARPAGDSVSARQGPVTTVYNGAAAAGLDDVGVACGV